MLKYSISALALSCVALTGCATVSVVPGSATVETAVSQPQSALRASAEAFQTTAVSRGWIGETRGFFDLARVLVEGNPEISEDTNDYATLIGVGVRSSDDVLATLTVDASDAAKALSDVSSDASAFLSAGIDASSTDIRDDLVSYERVLVQAQQVRRSFIEAALQANLEENSQVTVLIEQIDAEIDTARGLADQIAEQYSSRDTASSVS